MKALATAVLIALQALAAAALFLLSVHGPSALALAAPLYLAVAAALTWWAGRKSWWLLGAAGIALLAAAPGLHALLGLLEEISYRNRVAATQVSEVADEPIASAAGPIGVRLSYRVIVPAHGYFAILPAINGTDRAEGFGLQPKRWTFDGRAGIEFGPFLPGKQHAVSVELYPESLIFGQGGVRCVMPVSRPLPDAGHAAPLRVEIGDTPYRAQTRGDYDIAALYRNVMASGLPACKVGS
jgi:hypothetical protein